MNTLYHNDAPNAQVCPAKGFVSLPHCIITDTRLTDADLRLMCYLLTYARKQRQKSWPEQETIAAELGWSLDKVQRCVSHLLNLGYVTVTRLRDAAGRYYRNVYGLAAIFALLPKQKDAAAAAVHAADSRHRQPPPLPEPCPSIPQIRGSQSEKQTKNVCEKEQQTPPPAPMPIPVAPPPPAPVADVVVPSADKEIRQIEDEAAALGASRFVIRPLLQEKGARVGRYAVEQTRRGMKAGKVDRPGGYLYRLLDTLGEADIAGTGQNGLYGAVEGQKRHILRLDAAKVAPSRDEVAARLAVAERTTGLCGPAAGLLRRAGT